MKTLQDTLDSQIRQQLSFHKIAARLIEQRLGQSGIAVSEEQLLEIESKLLNLKGDAITISVGDDQVPSVDASSQEQIADVMRIDLSDSEEDLEVLVERFAKGLSEAIPEIIDEVSEPILQRLKRDAPAMLRSRRKERTSFEARLNTVWRKPLNVLEMLLAIAVEAGHDFNREFRPQASEENDCVFEVLTRLHARACQIASEVLVLLKSGHADGAHARWRSLHEVAVVGFFIKSAGSEIAERYLLHDAVESYRGAKEYRKHCKALGYEPLSEEEFTEIESTYQHLLSRFGPEYGNDYGWAAPAIGKGRPTFKVIEEDVGLEHLRPFYRMASHNVHANPKGVLFKLGLCPRGLDILLAGPSNTGLADPGHGAAISLAQISVALLTIEPNIDRLVVCNILMTLADEIGDEFLAAQALLESSGAG